KIINTSIEQFLNPDLNEQNGTDDEVFACAQEQLEAGVELIFVHFKGYDDIAHRYGPLTPQAAAKLEDLDTYVARLCSEFSGQVFVIADHGQHSASGERLGEHGEFRLPDLTVPWIQFTGENEK
ncbi:MAG TPA: hypothetical protein GX521_00955, partial [Firmicutes bacterium]|nr:hypothetical protein [Bacillota bacterium]